MMVMYVDKLAVKVKLCHGPLENSVQLVINATTV